MKRLFCLVLCLCLFVSLSFGEIPKVRQNYIVEKTYNRLWLLAGIGAGYGSYYLTKNPVFVRDRNGKKQYNYTPAVALGFFCVLFTIMGLVPDKDYLFPKLGKDETIWFEKEIKF